VPTKEYTIQIGDTFWKIAEKELGSGDRWTSIYGLNEDKIKWPNKLRAGQKIIIPVK
jgi:nucleoid-associated protein YgaU